MLKIDRSFVRDIPDDKDAAAIVGTVIAMAHALNPQVSRQGWRPGSRCVFSRRGGCDVMHGYLHSRALPAGQVVECL